MGPTASSLALPMRWASGAYAALLLLALIAFWPGYLSLPKTTMSAWLHVHAVTAGLWMFMLIAQPLAIHSSRRDFHRLVWRSSYFLMPVLLLSFVGLVHDAMQGKAASELGMMAYFFYVRVVLFVTFAASYVMAIVNRRNVAVHSRYTVCTGLSLIDPVIHRLAYRVLHNPDLNYQLITFGLVYAILVALIWIERHAKSGRQVFPIMLVAFFVGGLPLLFDFYTWGAPWQLWKYITASFAALPIP